MIQSRIGRIRRVATRLMAAGPAVFGVLSTAVLLAACSSSGGGASNPSSPTGPATSPSAAETSAAQTTAAATTPPATRSASAASDAASTTAISKAYVTFFDGRTTAADSVSVLQHGAVFKAALTAQANDPTAKKLAATVSKVVLKSTNLAAVTFSLVSSGAVLLPNTAGFAVREGGTWKVAAGTYCGLAKLQGGAPPACEDASITALSG